MNRRQRRYYLKCLRIVQRNNPWAPEVEQQKKAWDMAFGER